MTNRGGTKQMERVKRCCPLGVHEWGGVMHRFVASTGTLSYVRDDAFDMTIKEGK